MTGIFINALFFLYLPFYIKQGGVGVGFEAGVVGGEERAVGENDGRGIAEVAVDFRAGGEQEFVIGDFAFGRHYPAVDAVGAHASAVGQNAFAVGQAAEMRRRAADAGLFQYAPGFAAVIGISFHYRKIQIIIGEMGAEKGENSARRKLGAVNLMKLIRSVAVGNRTLCVFYESAPSVIADMN